MADEAMMKSFMATMMKQQEMYEARHAMMEKKINLLMQKLDKQDEAESKNVVASISRVR